MPEPDFTPPPTPPPVPPEPLTDAPASETSTGLKPHIAAGIACIFTLVGGIAFLILEKRNAFVRFYAMQSLLLGAISFVVRIAIGILGALLYPIPVIGPVFRACFGLLELAFWLAWLVVYVIQIVKAFSGVEWEIPYLGKIAREQLAKLNR